MIYTLKIYPKGGMRQAYRVIEISGNTDLNELCSVILNLFDFDYDHLYLFDMANERNPYRSSYTFEAEDPIFGIPDAPTLDELSLGRGSKFQLLYDFGDDWLFVIHVTKVSEGSGGMKLIKSEGKIYQYGIDYNTEWR